MERDCESELSKLNIEQNACIYHFGASVIHGQRSNILRLRIFSKRNSWVAQQYFALTIIIINIEKELHEFEGKILFHS